MEYLNLHVSTIDSPEFKGSDPVERATWLCLMRYCAGQENGGIIREAKAWKDRQWQQVCAVTLPEVKNSCRLYEWCGEDLHVWGYPAKREEEVRKKREAGRATAGQRWAKNQGPPDSSAGSSATSSATEKQPKPPDSLAGSSAVKKLDTERETETETESYGNGKGSGNGNGREAEREATRQPAEYLTDFPPLLVRILEVTGEPDDKTTRATYSKYFRLYGKQVLERALSSTKDRKLDQTKPRLQKPGAYFNETCMKIGEESEAKHAAG